MWCILESIFGRILLDFGKEDGGKLAPTSHKKSTLLSKRNNQLNASPLAPNWVRGVQDGNQIRAKFEEKMRSTWEAISASIFYRFLLDLGSQLGAMLATFSSKCVQLFPSAPRLLLGLCSFSLFWASWPPLGAIWAPFWEGWGLILRGFELYFGSFWRQFGHTTTLGKSTAPLGKPALSIHSAGVWCWMGWWGYAKRKELIIW